MTFSSKKKLHLLTLTLRVNNLKIEKSQFYSAPERAILRSFMKVGRNMFSYKLNNAPSQSHCTPLQSVEGFNRTLFFLKLAILQLTSLESKQNPNTTSGCGKILEEPI